MSYSDTDFKNAFIQRYKKAVSAVPNSIKQLNDSNFSKFSIKDGVLIELEFSSGLRWNSIGKEYIDKINEVIKKLDLKELGKTNLALSSLEDFTNSKIQSIQNFRI